MDDEKTDEQEPGPAPAQVIAAVRFHRFGGEPDEELDEVIPSGSSPRYAVAEWVGLAAASGLTGNVAYDLLKAWFQRVASRGTSRSNLTEVLSETPPDEQVELLQHVAFLAVFERCMRIDMDVPTLKELRLDSWKRVVYKQREAWEAQISSRSDSSFSATAWIPENDLQEHGVDVKIRSHRSSSGPPDVDL